MRQVASRGERPNVRRKYLSPNEARRVIEASARVGRQGERNKLNLTMIYRHDPRVSEAVDLRWTDFGLDAPKARPFRVRRLMGSKDSVQTMEPDTARLLKLMQADTDGPYVFRSERGGPKSVDAVQVICASAGREAD
jgi:integrase